ncbi:hypothetical protein PoB_007332100 [Plakobranchus ocellatus]|uniref:Uncharacterized protein n=1 Tax=Plakobranchus ocellatus TaxID=259542 RepID=A0AAV4DSL4_9GAST|nr:hypothetical protein PoB_007332100 [Plakobranchus ocellatus]
MSVSPFAGWSPFKKFMVISSKGSAKMADRSPFKIHRELNLILGDMTIEVTKLGNGDLMVKEAGSNRDVLGHPCNCQSSQELNSSKGVICRNDLQCC